MYVLDTNTLIYFFKGLGDVSKRLLAVPPNQINIPSIVLYELEVGIARSTSPKKRRKQLEDFTSLINILPFGAEEARSAASIRVNLEKKGRPIGPYDILIAAVAMTNQGILVTRNIDEFGRIKGLRLENWYE
jgi:tRNA(fMet)-specific endonuclease VapC